MRLRDGTQAAVAVCAAVVLALAFVSCGSDDGSGSSVDSGSTASSSSSKESTSASDDTSDDSAAEKNRDSRNSDAEPKKNADAEPEPKDDTERPTAKPNRPRGKTYLVTEVVDGATVHLDKPGETSVRIFGIETPETVHPSEPVECGGPAASKAAERLLSGKRVRLVYDPSQGRTDYYGRVLGYLDAPASAITACG